MLKKNMASQEKKLATNTDPPQQLHWVRIIFGKT
jgi:hypothetical protein